MNLTIKQFIDGLDPSSIPSKRRELLNLLASHLKGKANRTEPIQLNFICTHNSRRSHLGQVWAHAMANYFGIQNVSTFSGGTEATAVYPTIIDTLRSIGFTLSKIKEDPNPQYLLTTGSDDEGITLFSKVYNHPSNPSSDFTAIMTCDHAAENCPVVHGAEKRFSITYIDPKVSDNTPQQITTYNERSKQIATELYFVFNQLNKK